MTTAIIIGGGHNGLVCAFYLASAGVDVTVLERRGVVGGAAVTEEFHPGFRNSVASYTVSLLNPKIIRDLDLARHGLKVVERRLLNFLPLPDGRHLKIGAGKTKQEVAKFSTRDAQKLDAYGERLDIVADLLRDLVLQTPPNATSGKGLFAALPELFRAGALGKRLASLPLTMQQEVLSLFTSSAGDYLDAWFESDPIKAIYGFDGIVGNFASPYAQGTAYVLLHHCFGEVNGKKGIWGHAIGGMGAITQAMAKPCAQKGVTIRTDAGVSEVCQEWPGAQRRHGKGEVLSADLIVSNLNPKLLFTKLVDEAALPTDFLRRMQGWKCGSGTFRMNVALSELPSFTTLPGKELADHHTAGIVIAPSLRYMENAFFDARRDGWSKEPIVEMLIPSTLDDSLAPKGAHVASLFASMLRPNCQMVQAGISTGIPSHDLMIATVDNAPGFKASVVGRQIKSRSIWNAISGSWAGISSMARWARSNLFGAPGAWIRQLPQPDFRSLPVRFRHASGGGVTGAPGHMRRRRSSRI